MFANLWFKSFVTLTCYTIAGVIVLLYSSSLETSITFINHP